MHTKSCMILFLLLFTALYSFSDTLDSKALKKIDALISGKKFTEAKTYLAEIKIGLEDSPINVLFKYYFAKITFYEKDYYSSSFFINDIMKDPFMDMLPLEVRSDIWFLAAKVFYKIKLYAKSEELFNKCINTDFGDKNEVYLYLAGINLDKKNGFDRARNYYFRISRKKLDDDGKNIYDGMADNVLWEKIDTSKIAFNDPNVSDIVAYNGKLYIGLWNGGFCEYDYKRRRYEFYFGRVISDNIRCVYKYGTYVYVGTMGGVTRINTVDDSCYDIPELRNIAITSIQEDGVNVYYGTLYSGLYIYNKNEKKMINPGKDMISGVAGLYVTGNAIYITSYNGGLFYLKPGKLKTRDYKIKRIKNRYLPSSPITDMVRIKNKLWLSTFGNGVYTYDLLSGKVASYPLSNTGSDENYCLCISVYRNMIYCGTLGKGIFNFDLKKNKWKKMYIPGNYTAQDIKKIIFYDNSLFIGLLSEGIIKHDILNGN